MTATFLAGSLALLIGLSRLYLAGHYQSDVVAGLADILTAKATATWQCEKTAGEQPPFPLITLN